MPATRAQIAEIEQLYRQHGPALLLFAQAITGDGAHAQDAIHQVFLRLIEDGDHRRALDVKAYLFACVRNAACNYVRARRRNVELADDSAWFDPPDHDHAAELNLRRALNSLPEDQRQVAVLHVWGELTFSQIADLLEISANTAASRYRYALARLRDALCPTENSCAKP